MRLIRPRKTWDMNQYRPPWPYLTYPGPEGLIVVAAQKPSQDSSSDTHKH
jgi:hypothetical protein